MIDLGGAMEFLVGLIVGAVLGVFGVIFGYYRLKGWIAEWDSGDGL